MPQPSLPALRLPGETWTRLIVDRVDFWLGELDRLGKEVQQGDTFPGELPLNERQRLAGYLALPEQGGTHPADYELVLDPDYYLKVTTIPGYPVLQSPRWFNALSVEDTFKKMQRDFIYLLKKYEEQG